MMVSRTTAAVAAALVLTLPAASMGQWNDRTILTFSAPVLIPGATLTPGTYVFELANANSTRHLVRVMREADDGVVATIQAVPIKRPEANDDVVLQFNPTAQGTPPAIRAWFYPGTRYGHEFIYPEEQARLIAERTRTVALGIDVPGTDLEKGVLRTFDASGRPSSWQGDAATLGEWETWRRGRLSAEQRQSTATAVDADFRGTRVSLGDLDDDPAKYIGQRVSVDGEVDNVYGPRLFTIDDPRWGDLGGEMLVLLPTPLAALVKEDDRVTVSGTMRRFVMAEIEREWGWLGLDDDLETEVTAKPVLVAERLVGGDNDVALVIEPAAGAPTAVGTAGTTGTTPTAASLLQAGAIATAGADAVGQRVQLQAARVADTRGTDGFFIDAAGNRFVLVVPAQPTAVVSGDSVTIEGTILRMPAGTVTRLKGPAGLNPDVYVYATRITP